MGCVTVVARGENAPMVEHKTITLMFCNWGQGSTLDKMHASLCLQGPIFTVENTHHWWIQALETLCF